MNKHRHSDQGQPPRAGAPLSAHPLFPAIVALWLAALLAIGSMMIPAGLLERGVVALRLDQVIPAARPPLGFTARLLVAVALAVSGGLAGFLAVRRLARPAAAMARPRRRTAAAEPASPAEPATPSAAVDEEDSEDLARLAAARDIAPRRRALTSETEAATPAILDISAMPALEPLDPAPPAEPPAEPPAAPTASAPVSPTMPDPLAAPAPRFRSAAELGGEAAIRLCAAPLESLGVVQLVERFALAIHARRQRDAMPGAAATPALPSGSAPFAQPGEPRPVLTGRPFDMPGEASDSASAQNPLRARPALADEAAAGEPLAPGVELARWSLPEPAGEGEDVEEDLLPDPAADPSYSSLLDMRPATRVPPPLADFVRIEESAEAAPGQVGPQPVVVFPGQAVPAPPVATHLPGIDGPASPVQTEQALREALAALQRISGAA